MNLLATFLQMFGFAVVFHRLPEAVGHETGRHGKDEDFKDANERINMPTDKGNRAFASKLARVADVSGNGPHKGLPPVVVFLGLNSMFDKIENDGKGKRDPKQHLDGNPEVLFGVFECTPEEDKSLGYAA